MGKTVVLLRDTVKAIENYFTAVIQANSCKEKAFKMEKPLITSNLAE